LELFFGEMAQMLLQSPNAKPGVLQQAGFEFAFPRLEQALQDVLSG
jgi:hypothetical protein